MPYRDRPLGQELATHGSLFFPLACYDDDMTFLDVSWHWHEELEVILAVQGTLRVRTSAGTFLLQEGEGCFLNTGVPHEVVNAGEGPARLHSLVFHSRLISGSQDSVYWEKYLLPLLRDPERKLLRFLPDISWQKQAMDSIARAWEAAAQEPRGFEFTAREGAFPAGAAADGRNHPAPAGVHLPADSQHGAGGKDDGIHSGALRPGDFCGGNCPERGP